MEKSSNEEALICFEENIKYFQANQPQIIKKLSALESAIDKGIYNNKYEIVLEDEGYYDVLERATHNKLYGSNSKKYAQHVANSINFNKDENLYKTFKEYPLDIEDTKDISTLMKYIKTSSETSNQMISLDKFIFFGVGLGIHINSVNDKIHAKSYLIIEDDLELFRLSMLVAPYYLLASKSELIFSIFEDENEFESTSQKFINYQFYYNHYIKYFHMLNHNEDKIRQFHLKIVSQSQNIFFYNSILKQYIQPIKYIRQQYKFLNLLAPYKELDLQNKPTMLLAAGPSLQHHINFIKANQERFIIIAVSSVLNTLENNNISPDIVVHMDGFETSVAHFKKLNFMDFLKGTIFFLSARSPESLLHLLDKKQIFLYENGTFYKKSMGNLSAACVGSTTYLLTLALGVKELYLIGLDLALNQETGQTHSPEHEYVNTLKLDTKKHDDVMKFKTSQVMTRGNHQNQVITTNEYKLSIDSINVTSTAFKKDSQKVYNLNDGAGFDNTIALKISDLNIEQFKIFPKEQIKKNLLKIFTKFSSSTLNDKELKLLENKLIHLKSLQEKVTLQKSTIFISKELFLESLIEIFNSFSQNKDDNFYDISLVLQEFFKYTYSFMFDFFNTKLLVDEKESVSLINQYFSQALESILNKYIQGLET